MLGFYGIAETLDVSPDRPMASRTDVYFQSDAGGLIQDAIANYDQRARGVHPAIYPLWTAPLHRLTLELSPQVPVANTATYASRLLVNLASGLGIGSLAYVLRRRGFRTGQLTILIMLLVVSFGNTLAAIPDHFGLSLGVFAASLAVYLLPSTPRRRAFMLVLCMILAASITITNLFFPALLLATLAFRELTFSSRDFCFGLLVALVTLGGAMVIYLSRPDLQARVEERIQLYLNWTLTRDPPKAAAMITRSIIDSVVGPTPAVSSDINLERLPMLTYQPPCQKYVLWPYSPLQSTAAVAWLMILAVGVVRGMGQTPWRMPVVLLLLWWIWNAVFHTVWGDEFFLYTPHYAWALVTAAFLGWQSLPTQCLGLLSIPIVLANAVTLRQCREMLDAFAV